mgnify:CR=1 FL=1
MSRALTASFTSLQALPAQLQMALPQAWCHIMSPSLTSNCAGCLETDSPTHHTITPRAHPASHWQAANKPPLSPVHLCSSSLCPVP